MTREEAIEVLNMVEAYGSLAVEAKNMAIKALKQQPSDDCVSRQAVLEKINDWWGITSTSGEPTLCDYIRELPSVTPTTCIAKVTFSKDDLQELVDEKVEELAQHMESRWIPVSERLPEEDGDYLLFGKVVEDEDDYIFIGEYDSCGEQFGIWQEQFDRTTLGCIGSDFYEYASVLAWMPLPEPYKAETESE